MRNCIIKKDKVGKLKNLIEKETEAWAVLIFYWDSIYRGELLRV